MGGWGAAVACAAPLLLAHQRGGPRAECLRGFAASLIAGTSRARQRGALACGRTVGLTAAGGAGCLHAGPGADVPQRGARALGPAALECGARRGPEGVAACEPEAGVALRGPPLLPALERCRGAVPRSAGASAGAGAGNVSARWLNWLERLPGLALLAGTGGNCLVCSLGFALAKPCVLAASPHAFPCTQHRWPAPDQLATSCGGHRWARPCAMPGELAGQMGPSMNCCASGRMPCWKCGPIREGEADPSASCAACAAADASLHLSACRTSGSTWHAVCST